MKSSINNVKGRSDQKEIELFHEFLRGYTSTFTNNIYAIKTL